MSDRCMCGSPLRRDKGFDPADPVFCCTFCGSRWSAAQLLKLRILMKRDKAGPVK